MTQPGSSVTWGALKKNAEEAMKPLAEGTRVIAVVEEAGYKKASTGSDMLVVKLAVAEGQYANRKLFNNFVLTPDNSFAMTMFFRNLAAFGVTDEVFAQLETVPGGVEQHLTIIADAITGRKVAVTMGEPRVYQNVARDNPASFESVPGQQPVRVNTTVPAGNAHNSGAPAGTPPIPGSAPAATPVNSGPPVPSF